MANKRAPAAKKKTSTRRPAATRTASRKRADSTTRSATSRLDELEEVVAELVEDYKTRRTAKPAAQIANNPPTP